MSIKSKSAGKSVVNSAGGSSAGSLGGNTGTDAEHQRIESLALVTRIIEDNPDLFNSFVEDILIALAEAKAGHVLEYDFDAPEESC